MSGRVTVDSATGTQRYLHRQHPVSENAGQPVAVGTLSPRSRTVAREVAPEEFAGVMAPPETLISFVKAAPEVAKSFVLGIGRNVPLLLASLAASLFVCFAPGSLLPGYIADLRWAFLALSVFLFSYFLLLWYFSRRPHKHALWHLRHLGEDEKVVLKGYLRENKAVRYFGMFHGPASTLVGRGILVHAAGLVPDSNAPFAIQPYILVYLRKHPETIGMKHEEIGSAELSDERHIDDTYGA
jgi:hypothetical protein